MKIDEFVIINQLMSMAKIFMIGFEFRGISYASNVFYQVRQNIPTYHIRLVSTNVPHLFSGTLILEKNGNEFRSIDKNDRSIFPYRVLGTRRRSCGSFEEATQTLKALDCPIYEFDRLRMDLLIAAFNLKQLDG